MELDVLRRANEINRDMNAILHKIEKLKEGLSILSHKDAGSDLHIIGSTCRVELDQNASMYAMNNNITRLEKQYDHLSDMLEDL